MELLGTRFPFFIYCSFYTSFSPEIHSETTFEWRASNHVCLNLAPSVPQSGRSNCSLEAREDIATGIDLTLKWLTGSGSPSLRFWNDAHNQMEEKRIVSSRRNTNKARLNNNVIDEGRRSSLRTPGINSMRICDCEWNNEWSRGKKRAHAPRGASFKSRRPV